MARKRLNPETLWKIPRVGAPVPSPDGSRVVVPVTTHDLGTNQGTTRLWLVPAKAEGAGGGGREDPARVLTTADVSSREPVWSPDGLSIAFTRKPGGEPRKGEEGRAPKHPGVPQLHVIPVDGGEAERLTDLPFGAVDPRWFPDGRRIAFLSEVYREAPSLEATAARKKVRDEDPVRAHVTEDRWYRYWDKWLTERRFLHLFVLDLGTGEVADLTPDLFRIHSLTDASDTFTISPDGKEIAFTAFVTDPPYEHHLVEGVYAVKVRPPRKGQPAPRVRKLSRGHPANAVRPVYSPDGRFLVYGIQRERDFYADRVRLVALERATGRKTVLTDAWDASASDWRFGEDPDTVWLLSEVDARVGVFRLDLPRALEDPDAHPPEEIVRGGTFAGLRAAGGRLFSACSSLAEPPEACVIEPGTGHVRRLTAFTRAALDGVQLSRVEDVRFAGAGGDEVQMFVLFPPGARPPKRAGAGGKKEVRWPLVHMIHGGPHGTFGDVWHWRWNAQVFASPGYVVACVNFHGSTSFGEAFTSSILGRWGDQPYEDILAATDALLERGWVKKRKMAISGGSYGGYLTSWIASQTDRFACAVCHAGVSDFQTQYASDVTHGRGRAMGGEPWADQEGMDRYNPMRHARGFGTPMLVIHGERDYRVPSDQGLELYGVYRARGLPARLVVYPDENHWILKPRNSLHWYGEVLGWFERWL